MFPEVFDKRQSKIMGGVYKTTKRSLEGLCNSITCSNLLNSY